MTKRIYIASSSEWKTRRCAQEWMLRAKAAGFEVTHNWVAAFDAASKSPTDDELRKHAHDDLMGVIGADVFWLQSSHEKSEGAAFEFGVAYRRLMTTQKVRILISGPSSNIFRKLHGVECYRTHNEAFAALVGGA